MVSREQIIKAVNLTVLTLLSIAIVYGISFYFFSDDNPAEIKQCNQIDPGSAFYYESCYDAYSQKIFFGVKRGYDDFSINSLNLNFFDFSNKTYQVNKFPDKGGTEIYKIPSDKNPGILNLILDVASESVEDICPIYEGVFVAYCSGRISGEDVELNYNPLSITTTNIVNLGSEESADTFSLSLVQKEKIWESQCSSKWDCSTWEECINGIQKRTCVDSKDCFIPTNSPEETQLCNGTCIENWECKWSSCSNGITVPSCKDLNGCGSEFSKPSSLKCDDEECVPNISCSEWSSCLVDYTFLDIYGSDVSTLGGIKTRTCEDNNGCAKTTTESTNCSLGIDIYTESFKFCGTEYLGVYNALDNTLIARIDQGTNGNLHTNIYFDDINTPQYCDYCNDGILDGDETKIDCGGSCISCYDKYGQY